MKRSQVYIKLLPFLVLIMALVFIATGSRRSHKVYNTGTEEFGILTYQKVSERQMVEDTTFHGVDRRDQRLYTTYDRSQPRGKTSCPT